MGAPKKEGYKVYIIIGAGVAITGLTLSSGFLIAFGVGMALSNALFHDKETPRRQKAKEGATGSAR